MDPEISGSNPEMINLFFIKSIFSWFSTDIINYDTVRNAIKQIASPRQPESTITCFGRATRSRALGGVNHCSNKNLIRSDHVAKIWKEFGNIEKSSGYNSSIPFATYLTGPAREKARVSNLEKKNKNFFNYYCLNDL